MCEPSGSIGREHEVAGASRCRVRRAAAARRPRPRRRRRRDRQDRPRRARARRRRSVVLRGAARASGAAPFDPLVAAIRSHPRWPAIAADVLSCIRSDRRGATHARSARCSASSARREAPRRGWRGGHGPAGERRPGHDLGRDLPADRRARPDRTAGDRPRRPAAADHATIDVLPGRSRGPPREPLLIVGIYRTDEMPRASPVRRLRVELRRDGRLHEIVLGPLDAASTAALAARTLGARPDDILAGRLFDRSQGLPLFVEELVRGPPRRRGDRHRRRRRHTRPRRPAHPGDTARQHPDPRRRHDARATATSLATAALLGDDVDATLVDELAGGNDAWRRCRHGARHPRRPRRRRRRIPARPRARGPARRPALGRAPDPAPPDRRGPRGPRRGAARRRRALAPRRRARARPSRGCSPPPRRRAASTPIGMPRAPTGGRSTRTAARSPRRSTSLSASRPASSCQGALERGGADVGGRRRSACGGWTARSRR